MSENIVEFYGFTAVPRDPEVLFKDHPTASGDHPKQDLFEVTDFPLPDSPVVREVDAFVKVLSVNVASTRAPNTNDIAEGTQ